MIAKWPIRNRSGQKKKEINTVLVVEFVSHMSMLNVADRGYVRPWAWEG